MKSLLLLRHAKSSWDDAHVSDHDRPLNQRGLRDAPRMGRLIRQQGLTPDLIVSSTAVRAMSTARLVADPCGYTGEIDLAAGLYQAPPREYLAHLQQLPDQHAAVLIVGHNPGLEDLLEAITGAYHKMPTAALAYVTLDLLCWRELAEEPVGRLVNLWRPKELGE